MNATDVLNAHKSRKKQLSIVFIEPITKAYKYV